MKTNDKLSEAMKRELKLIHGTGVWDSWRSREALKRRGLVRYVQTQQRYKLTADGQRVLKELGK